MPEIKAVEVFSEGVWNKIPFDEADLHNMADSFAELGLSGKVPVKVGHDNALGDSTPAYGWAKSCYVVGKKLLMDLVDVPQKLIDAIKAGRFKNVSIELLKDAQVNGKTYPFVPDGLAILGAAMPAVSNLADLQSVLHTRDKSVTFAARLEYSTPIPKARRQKFADDATIVKGLSLSTEDLSNDDIAALVDSYAEIGIIKPLRIGKAPVGHIGRLYRAGGGLKINVWGLSPDVADTLKSGKFEQLWPTVVRNTTRGAGENRKAYAVVLEEVTVITLNLTHSRRTEPVNAEVKQLKEKLAKLERAEAERISMTQAHAKKAALIAAKAHSQSLIDALEKAVRDKHMFPAFRDKLIRMKKLNDPMESLHFSRDDVKLYLEAHDRTASIRALFTQTAIGKAGDAQKSPVDELSSAAREKFKRGGYRDMFHAMEDAVRDNPAAFSAIMDHDLGGGARI